MKPSTYYPKYCLNMKIKKDKGKEKARKNYLYDCTRTAVQERYLYCSVKLAKEKEKYVKKMI